MFGQFFFKILKLIILSVLIPPMCNYAPTLKKLKRHIALGLSVLPFVRPLQISSYSFEIL